MGQLGCRRCARAIISMEAVNARVVRTVCSAAARIGWKRGQRNQSAASAASTRAGRATIEGRPSQPAPRTSRR